MKRPSTLAGHLEAFFTDRLQRQRQASPHTIMAYRDTFRLLLRYARDQHGLPPSRLSFQDLDAPTVGGFLDQLEQNGCSARTRNLRLSAVRSFFRYLAYEEPGLSGLVQRVLAIPNKRYDRQLIEYLTVEETEALVAAPDQSTWLGRRDHAMLRLTTQSGLRVSEVTGLQCGDVHLKAGPHVRCHGKGRKERCTPLTKAVKTVMTRWMQERNGAPRDPVFPNARDQAMSPDGFQYILSQHVATAREHCPSLVGKRISPHVLRHTAAMFLLHSGVDPTVISLWLGHESIETTQIYLHADMAMKEAALQKAQPIRDRLRKFKPDDELMAFLKSL